MKFLQSLLFCSVAAFSLVACSHNPELASNDELADSAGVPTELAMNAEDQAAAAPEMQPSEDMAAQEATPPATQELMASVNAMEADLAQAEVPSNTEAQPEEVKFAPAEEVATLPAPTFTAQSVGTEMPESRPSEERAPQMVAQATKKPERKTEEPKPAPEPERSTLPTTQPVAKQEVEEPNPELAEPQEEKLVATAPKMEQQAPEAESEAIETQPGRREVQEANPSVEGFMEQHPFAIALMMVGLIGIVTVFARYRKNSGGIEL